MAKRPDITVILLSHQGAIRTDFGKSFSAPVLKLRETIDVEASLFDSVRQVIDNQPPPGYRTIVVSANVWSQIVSLPQLSIADVEPEELEVALKFETETLSGIDIEEIALAYSHLGRSGDVEQYWVSAVHRSELEEINQYLSTAGCREIAITHPAGRAGDPAQERKVKLIEVWGDLAYFLTHDSTKLERIKQATTETFQAGDNVLVGLGIRTDELFDDRFSIDSIELQDLNREQDLDDWSGRVAANFLKYASQFPAPLIQRIKRSRGTPVRHLVSVAIALGVVALCVWHRNFTLVHNAEVILQIAEIQQPAIEKEEYDRQLLTILDERAEIELEDSALADDLKRIRFFLDTQTNRISRILTLLIELRTSDLVIEEIGGTEDGMSISGISLNGESAQALAKRLREHATPLGWMVNPARLTGQEKLTTGGPWDFEILLTDTGPFEFAIQPRKKTAPLLTPKP